MNGKKKGAVEIVIDNLPGFLDNLKINDKGEIWIATPSLRDAVSTLVNRSTIVRRISLQYLTLKLFLILSNQTHAGGLKIDPIKGEIV